MNIPERAWKSLWQCMAWELLDGSVGEGEGSEWEAYPNSRVAGLDGKDICEALFYHDSVAA